jgi:hypothetical protein
VGNQRRFGARDLSATPKRAYYTCASFSFVRSKWNASWIGRLFSQLRVFFLPQMYLLARCCSYLRSSNIPSLVYSIECSNPSTPSISLQALPHYAQLMQHAYNMHALFNGCAGRLGAVRPVCNGPISKRRCGYHAAARGLRRARGVRDYYTRSIYRGRPHYAAVLLLIVLFIGCFIMSASGSIPSRE